jgi:hypothetical protein
MARLNGYFVQQFDQRMTNAYLDGMVRSRYPYLTKQRHRWFVRMVVPADVQNIIGKAVFKVATGDTDEHEAVSAAAPIMANFQRRIATAREAGKRLEQISAEQLAERYWAERNSVPERAEHVVSRRFSTHRLRGSGQRRYPLAPR